MFDHLLYSCDDHLDLPAVPPDAWTARLPERLQEVGPHVVERDGQRLWVASDKVIGISGRLPDNLTALGRAPGLDETGFRPSNPEQRLADMERDGIHASIVYGAGALTGFPIEEPEARREVLRAWNDWAAEVFNAFAPDRLSALPFLPTGSVEEAVQELQRCVELGHKGAIVNPFDLDLGDDTWDRLWAAAAEADLPISFHIGSGDLSDLMTDPMGLGTRANFSRVSSMIFMQNVTCIADLIFGGVCHRFPDLKMVSVESGVGWIPSYLEAADWQWANSEVRKEHPEYDLLPSEYFKRQIYGCFWFEADGLQAAVNKLPDNVMWETDFPHPTCQHPGLENGFAQHPADYAERAFQGIDDATIEKVLNSTAAALYGL